MEGEEFDALVADIKASGLRERIMLYEGKILDGRNRYRACLKAGFEPVTIQLPPICDPVAYVISANIRRRHLTADQKRDLIAKLIKATPEKSDRQIAETAKASPTTVGTVRAKMEAKGDVSNLDTRTDTKGRKQPARKPPRRTAKKKRDIICERQGLVHLLIALDRDLAVLLSKFFETYPDQIDAFVADLTVFAAEIEEADKENAADDIPDSLRRDQ